MTQNEMVLDYIKRNGSITPMEAFESLSITRLAAVVWNLKRAGHDIQTVVHRRGQVWWAEYKGGNY